MKSLLFTLLLGVSLSSEPALAQSAKEAVELTGQVMLERTVEVDGAAKVELVTPKVVVPGDKLVFTTKYRNTSPATVQNFALTNALPAPVVLDQNVSADLIVSVDGGRNWGGLAELTVVSADGSKRPAQAADVTHIRWVIDAIAPGVTGEVGYRAKVR